MTQTSDRLQRRQSREPGEVKGLPIWLRGVLRRLGLERPPHAKVLHERDLGATMSDGTVLLADRWRPAGVASAPLVLVRTPYGRRSLAGLLYGRLLAHFGFQVVIQSCRGTQDSGGAFDRPFLAERADGRDTVAWLRQQAWYPGSFATVGGSYFGYTQLAIAAEAGAELAAAVWTAAPTSTRDICWPDETFSPGIALRWTAQVVTDPTATFRHLMRLRVDDKRLRAAMADAPLIDSYAKTTHGRVPYFEDWLRGAAPDSPVWQEQDLAGALDQISCPVLVQAGWYDIFLDASLEQYEHLRERGIDARLTVGPWHHVQVTAPCISDMVQFLTEVMLEGPLRASGHPVHLIEVGSTIPQVLDRWPADVVDSIYYLVGGELSADLPADEGSREATSFTYDPANPTPAVGGALLEPMGAGPRDNRKLESRADVVMFDSPPLTRAVALRGAPRVALDFSSDREATCVFLRLCDVSPEGRSTNLTDRMVPLRAGDRDGSGMWKVDVALRPVAATLLPGHRLRLQVSSGAFPRFARHPGTADAVASATTYLPARQTIHHSLARPGRVTLPLAPSHEGTGHDL